MKKIVVASDSFKGSVSSIEVAECAELAIHKVFPDCEVVKIPVGGGAAVSRARFEAVGRRERSPRRSGVRSFDGPSGPLGVLGHVPDGDRAVARDTLASQRHDANARL